MKTRTIPLLLAVAIASVCVAGTKIIRLPRATTFPSNTVFSASIGTGYTGRVTVRVEAHDLARGLGPWITNSGGGASSVTNAISVVRSNGASISASATSLDFIEGTNVTLRATNAAGVVTVQINSSGGSGSVDPTNQVLVDIIATGAITNIGSSLLSASNYYARIVSLTTNDNVSLTLSNAQNNTAYILAPGSYAITPSVLSSNLSGATQYRGITFANKTNVAILGLKGSTIIDGSSEYGELLVITNSSGITVDGIAWYGKTNHNWTQVIPTNHLWAGIRIANSEKITFQNCDISRHFNHGICDLSANFSSVTASTNQIIIQNNVFEDIGSWRLNAPVAYDGTAIVPTGWTVRGNKIENVLRGIEPYLALNGQPSVIWNCIIENNEIENAFDFGISTVGNTNFHGVRVTGNTIRTHPGFAYHGSNALNSAGTGILWNGGNEWSIDNNIISGAFAQGIAIGAGVSDGSITGNRIFDVTNSVTAIAFMAQDGYRMKISGNRINGSKNSALYLYGLRDSEVSGNQLVNPSYSGTGIRIASFGSLIASNLNVRDNFIFDSVNSRLTYGIEDQLGGTFKVRFSGNDIQNAGTKYFNQSTTEWTIRDLDAGSTNRLIAAHEVRTQIEAGSNITLATNSSGVVTITGAAGGAGSLPANANQISTNTSLAIISGVKLTNAVNEGIAIFNGDSSNRANLIVKGASNPKFRLTSISPPQVLQLSSTEISTDVGGGQAYITISPEAYPTLRINTNSLEAINPGYDLGVLGTPWAYAYVSTNRNKGIHLFGGQTASSLLRLDSGTNVATVTIGSGLSFDGTTLTATGGASGTNFAGIIVTNLADIKGNATITSNLTLSGSGPMLFSVINASNYFGSWVQFAGMFPGVNKVFASQDASGNGIWTNKTWLDAGVFTNSVTAQSFIGSGTNTPYLLLSSPNGASFGLSVNTNRTIQSTNTFDFSSVSVAQVISAHSSSAGQVVWTNASSKILTNMVGISFDYGLLYAATNTIAGTNFAINFSPNNTNHIDIYTTNWWAQWTNISGLAQGSLANKTIRITPSAPGQNLTNIWPVGRQHGIYQWTTNANSPIWTVLTNAKTYVLSLTAYGTNIHATMSLWEP